MFLNYPLSLFPHGKRSRSATLTELCEVHSTTTVFRRPLRAVVSAGPADQPPAASGAPGPSSAGQGGQRGASVQTLARLLMLGCRERAFYLGKRAFLDT